MLKHLLNTGWHMVCIPKSQGGLGVINLTTQNEALLLDSVDRLGVDQSGKQLSVGKIPCSCPL